MENKNKPRLKISVFDIVIIVVVIVAAGLLIFFWRQSGKSSDTVNTRPVHYTIEFNGMLTGTAEKIKPGDTIMDSDKKFIMGTVESVTISPATTTVPNRQTGDTLTVEDPGKELAAVVLVCDCSINESQLKAASGYVVSVGKEVHAAGPGYAGIGYVIGIDREDVGQ